MSVSATIARSSLLIGCCVGLLSLSGYVGGEADRSSLSVGSASAAPQSRGAERIPRDDTLKLGCGLQEGSGSSRSDPRFREKSVVIGPVVFFPARSEYARLRIEELARGRFPLQELLVALTRGEITTGDSATVRLVGQASRHAAFLSSRVPYKRRGYRVSEGARALTGRACKAGPRFRFYTTYNVGFLVDSAQCVPIAVSVKGHGVDREVVQVGTRECS